MQDHQNRPVTIVCGATGSVGGELVARLVARGHHVVAAGRDRERLEQLALEHEIETCEIDACEAGSLEKCIAGAATRFGHVTGVANCIGSILLKPAHRTTDEEFMEVLETNLCSSFAVIRGAARAMRKTGGSVVLVSSAAARLGITGHEAIAAAKAGVEGLARAAAATYAGSGIRVNAVAPGLVRSGMSEKIWSNPAAAQQSEQMHALGRLGEPADVASMIAWLLEPENSWVTGQVIGIDGGLGTVLARPRQGG